MRTYCKSCGGLKTATADAVACNTTMAANHQFVTYTSQQFTTTVTSSASSSTENHWCKCPQPAENNSGPLV